MDTLKIKTFKSRFFMGKYTLDTIWIREDLSREEREKTILHEMEHHKFYSRNRVLRFYLAQSERLTYKVFITCAVVFAWFYFPWAYLLLLMPSWLDCFHEIHVSLKYSNSKGLILALFAIFITYAAFWVRLLL